MLDLLYSIVTHLAMMLCPHLFYEPTSVALGCCVAAALCLGAGVVVFVVLRLFFAERLIITQLNSLEDQTK